jgi:hypothetical protein
MPKTDVTKHRGFTPFLFMVRRPSPLCSLIHRHTGHWSIPPSLFLHGTEEIIVGLSQASKQILQVIYNPAIGYFLTMAAKVIISEQCLFLILSIALSIRRYSMKMVISI